MEKETCSTFITANSIIAEVIMQFVRRRFVVVRINVELPSEVISDR